jgi:uncharacterized protein with FMN-binding domain
MSSRRRRRAQNKPDVPTASAMTARPPVHNEPSVRMAPSAKGRRGKLSGSIIAISSAAIVSVYALGRANTSAVSDQFLVDAPTVAASVASNGQAAAAGRATVAPSASGSQSTSTPTATYKDGSYTGSGNSRHGGMQVKVVIKDGKITSANVTSCGTRYPCSDINPLISLAISKQSVPVNHVSGATDSSQAYRQALTSALKQAGA